MLPKNTKLLFQASLLVIKADVAIITNEGWTADDVLRGLMSYRFFFFCVFGLASSQATLVTCRSQA